MATRTIEITHKGVSYVGQVGRIESTYLGWEDHGIVTAYLGVNLDDGSFRQVGGYCLANYNADTNEQEGTAFGLDHVMAIMKAINVRSWEEVKGKSITLLLEDSGWNSKVMGITGIHNDDNILIFEEHTQRWIDRATLNWGAQ